MNSLRRINIKWLAWVLPGAILAVAVGLYLWLPAAGSLSGDTSDGIGGDNHRTETSTTAVTFNRDVAPIVFKECSSCHHPGEAVPFHLLSYDDFKKRAKLIKDVVQRRYMPPWMPAPGFAEFKGERVLSDDEITLISRWADEGAVEGDEGDRPEPPRFEEGWTLGKPDFVAKMPDAYSVPAEGKDIYRNFVVPMSQREGKWVKGVQVKTAGTTVVHHGFVFIDSTGDSAKQNDAAEAGVGYSGMDPGSGVGRPTGFSLSWQPGKQASLGPDGMSWWLPRHSDLVLQMHIRPSGKVESVQAEVGLYFADGPPMLQPSSLMLRSIDIDIPAGAKDHAIESSYVTPVDLEITEVLPHAHYLARKVAAWATLPSGERRWLLRIDDWNFDWQGDYQYVRPLALPAGTQLSMRYEFDNSADNARNPNQPPKRVTYGLNSADEMAELHLQVLTREVDERRRLETDYRNEYAIPDAIAVARALLKSEPQSSERMVGLGVALLGGGELDEATGLLQQALAMDPADAKAHYHLGHAYAMENDVQGAVKEWQEAVRIDPRHFRAHNNLGYWHFSQRDFKRAEEHLLAAIDANENDVMSRVNLARVYAARGEWTSAEAELREATKIEPLNEMVKEAWQKARARLRVE
jgi:tetratricopeptide (TPR) repeat protein